MSSRHRRDRSLHDLSSTSSFGHASTKMTSRLPQHGQPTPCPRLCRCAQFIFVVRWFFLFFFLVREFVGVEFVHWRGGYFLFLVRFFFELKREMGGYDVPPPPSICFLSNKDITNYHIDFLKNKN